MKKNILVAIITLLLISPQLSIAAIFEDPSLEYCIQHGGQLQTESITPNTGNGNTYNVCIFKDKTECETSDYMENKCTPGQYTDWKMSRSKEPDLVFDLAQSGWVSDLGRPTSNYDYTEESQSKYFYYRVAVKNRNLFSTPSQPTTLNVYTTTTQTIRIPSLKAGQTTKYYDIYIPTQKDQNVDIEINADHSLKESDYSNNKIYNRPSKTQKKQTKYFLYGIMAIIILGGLFVTRKCFSNKSK